MKKLENLKTKLQESKKFRTQFASVLVAAVVVVGCAVAIPIGVHAQGVKKAATTQEAASAHESLTAEPVLTELQTTEPTTEAPKETIPETTATAAVTENTTAKKSASKNSASSGSAKKSTSASTTKKSNSSSKSSGSSGNSGSKGSAAAAQTTVPSHDWPKAKVDAIIAKARAYGESLGLVWDEGYQKYGYVDANGVFYDDGGNWSFPERSTDGDEQVVLDNLKYQLDHLAAKATREGVMPGAGFKVYAERVPCELCGPVLGIEDYQWTFYVSPNSGA